MIHDLWLSLSSFPLQVSRLEHSAFSIIHGYLDLGDAYGHGHFIHRDMAFRNFFFFGSGVFRDSLAVATLHVLSNLRLGWLYLGEIGFQCFPKFVFHIFMSLPVTFL